MIPVSDYVKDRKLDVAGFQAWLDKHIPGVLIVDSETTGGHRLENYHLVQQYVDEQKKLLSEAEQKALSSNG